jgi:hypothetical protein
MGAKMLRKSVAMLRGLLAELDQGEPDPNWRLRHRIAKTVVRSCRVEMDYSRLKAEHPDVLIEFLEPGTEPTAAEKKLFSAMIETHLAIHRKLKTMRELH